MWEGFSSWPPISRYCPLWLMPHGFVQSHVGERRLPYVPYKLEPKTRVLIVVHMCLGLKLIRHMWEASLPDVRLNKSVRHEQKWTIPANWGPRRETFPQLIFTINLYTIILKISYFFFGTPMFFQKK